MHSKLSIKDFGELTSPWVDVPVRDLADREVVCRLIVRLPSVHCRSCSCQLCWRTRPSHHMAQAPSLLLLLLHVWCSDALHFGLLDRTSNYTVSKKRPRFVFGITQSKSKDFNNFYYRKVEMHMVINSIKAEVVFQQYTPAILSKQLVCKHFNNNVSKPVLFSYNLNIRKPMNVDWILSEHYFSKTLLKSTYLRSWTDLFQKQKGSVLGDTVY